MAADTQRVNLDLDALDREHVRTLPEKRAPFAVRIGGKVVEFKDAVEIDSILLMNLLATPSTFFRTTLTEDNYKHVMEVFRTPGQFPGYKMRALMESYQEYYGLDDQGNVVASRR